MNTNPLKQDLQAVFDKAISALKGIDNNTLNAATFEDSWTPGQVAEHIIICCREIPDNQTEPSTRRIDEHVKQLQEMFLDMEQKFKSAPAVTPRQPSHQKEELLVALSANCDTTTNIVTQKDLSALCLDMEFPFMGYLTRYEWLRFIEVHTKRHITQVNNIKRLLRQSPLIK